MHLFPANLSEILNTLPEQATQRLNLIAVETLRAAHMPPFSPDSATLLLGEWNTPLEEHARHLLATVYPADHPLMWVLPKKPSRIFSLQTWQSPTPAGGTLYIAPLENGSSLESFQEIIAHLRAPDGCPWDREQTHQTLRKHLLEESYETLDAIDAGNATKMREEFGDLLLQIVLNAQIGFESSEFNMAEIIKGVYDKIIRRHPHVFGEVQVSGVNQVLSNWENLKQEERRQDGEMEKGMLDGLPAALPALSLAQEIQDRAARVGFDWPEISGVLEKIREEIDEVNRAETQPEVAEELGDVFFVLSNFARWKGVDAESALREANLKFRRRFAWMESRARVMNCSLKEMSPQALDDLWNQAKQQLSTAPKQ
ncbi:MAG: nucleoside triphosphate pyrophosphohydrolase [Anaerolineae bacterium CG_4_9_14_3_um_filter_57_17]|nr:nucleoside triphosphate pyrophosphohydrolase [bacterium]NCT20922.1 nucleoside triphosphate pyrophosphohydrolase [bacterium]PJB68071.1 MAG: nucleoside triphosphate pyrophosphohydrolase [Anaerolineae bacterium CG_4_9_14_3_um_filter_57_17]